jgi:hypothetical protein
MGALHTQQSKFWGGPKFSDQFPPIFAFNLSVFLSFSLRSPLTHSLTLFQVRTGVVEAPLYKFRTGPIV